MVNTISFHQDQWDSQYTPVSARDVTEEFKVTMKNPGDFKTISFEQIATPKILSNKTIKVRFQL